MMIVRNRPPTLPGPSDVHALGASAAGPAASMAWICWAALAGPSGGITLFALGRGLRRIRRPRLVTRALAVLVWFAVPATIGMGLALMYGSQREAGMSGYPLAVGVELLNAATCLMQLYGATRCLRITRRTPLPG